MNPKPFVRNNYNIASLQLEKIGRVIGSGNFAFKIL